MKALAIGGAMIDTIAIIDSDRIEKMSMTNADSAYLLLESGRKIDAREVSMHTGGGAINAAVAMARLGLNVSVLSKLGKDDRAAAIVNRLRAEKIDTSVLIYSDSHPTGASVLIASHDKDAAIFTYRGANSHLVDADIEGTPFDAELIYIAPLSDGSADTFPLIIDRAKNSGAFLAVNPGIRQLSARGSVFRRMLPNIDVLILNRREAEGLLPLLIAEFGNSDIELEPDSDAPPPRLLASGLSGGGYDVSLARFLTAILQSGTKTIAITDSINGSYVAAGDAITYCPSLSGVVAGTAGAGDAFGATLSSELAAGAGTRDALKRATANASSVVSHVDTQTGLQDRTALLASVAERSGDLKLQQWTFQR